MKCSEAIELISSRLDGVISPEEDEKLTAHLAQCEQCRALEKELARLDALLPELEAEPPQALHEGVMREVKKQSRQKKEQRKIISFVSMLAAAAALFAVLAGFDIVKLPELGGSDMAVSMVGLWSGSEKTLSAEEARRIAEDLARKTGCHVLLVCGEAPEAGEEVLDAEVPDWLTLKKMTERELQAQKAALAENIQTESFGEAGEMDATAYLLAAPGLLK